MRSLLLIPVALFAVACAAKSSVPQSTVTGTAALSSFPSAPSSVTATDEGGHAVHAAVGADGGFSLDLPKGHTYQLAVATEKGDVSLVFPRTNGKLDKSFVVKSDGASVRLGAVRYLAKAPTTGFHVTSSAGSTSPPSGQTGADQGGNCVDCVNDDQNTICEGGGESGGTAAEAQGAESASNAAPSSTGNTSEADNADQADPNQEMAVGDQNAPDQVDGCGGDGPDGDTTQQEGEH